MFVDRCEDFKSQIKRLPTIDEISELNSKLKDQLEKNNVSFDKINCEL